MNKKFLFVTPLTPKAFLTPLRKSLFEQFIESLKKQTYSNWEALLLGEESRIDGKIKYLSLGAESKEIKLIFAREYILNLPEKPDYIIRIDDDDIINPNILMRVSTLSFDCFADMYHAFYDLTTGKISLQKRSWMANTVIHKYEHAMCELNEDKMSLIQCDHSKDWIKYYENKKIIYADRKSPVYLRILSPTTVTSGIYGMNKSVSEKYTDFKNNIVKLKTKGDIDFTQYNSYLKGFGKWKYMILKDFEVFQYSLKNIWESFYGESLENKTLIKLKTIWNSFVG